MAENAAQTDDSKLEPGEGVRTRQRSTIGFPYADYDGALAVAIAIHNNAGHGTCSVAQLAPWMAQSVKSSGFRTQLASSRLFGLIDSDNTETYRLTSLGTRVVDPAQARAAKVEAFLKVPLFAALFEKYKTGVVPPGPALEREMVALGVPEKQKARARQVFENSAQQSGFRDHGANRLVMPAVMVPPPVPPTITRDSGGGNSNGSGVAPDVGLDLDSLLIALLQKIPSQGEPWPKERRVRWFKTFAMNVSQVYDGEDDPVELNISST